MQVRATCIREIDVDRPVTVLGVRVSCVPANHCPGAVMLIFERPGRPPVLHSGDCRYERALFRGSAALAALRNRAILHLDTTYCAPQHTFPLQREVVAHVVGMCRAEVAAAREAGAPPPLLVFGSYTIGKEHIFMAVRSRSPLCVPRRFLLSHV